jgi:hypothetical protein
MSCAGAGLHRPSDSTSISSWSMGLMRLRLVMEARRRRKVAEGPGVKERCWRLPGDRARFGLGRPVRQAPLLGSLLWWVGCGVRLWRPIVLERLSFRLYA